MRPEAPSPVAPTHALSEVTPLVIGPESEAAEIDALHTQIEALKKENTRLSEAVAARDGFLAFAAHELMNGVSPIVGRVDILRLRLAKLTPQKLAQDLD